MRSGCGHSGIILSVAEMYVMQNKKWFLLLKNSKILVLKQNNPFQQTVLKSGNGQFLNLLTSTDVPNVEDRKWFLLTCLLSLPIFDCSKVTKS